MSVKLIERKLNRWARMLSHVINADTTIYNWWVNRANDVYADINERNRRALGLNGRNGNLTSPEGDIVKTSHNGVQTVYEQVTQYHAADESSGIPGLNLCPFSTPQCRKHCLGHTSGRMVMDNSRAAQQSRTEFMYDHPLLYQVKLYDECRRHAIRIHKNGKLMVLRLNGTSDIPWEKSPHLLDALRQAGVDEFQDYTKWDKQRRGTPDDYYIAQSVTEDDDPRDVPALAVAIVPRVDKLPDTWFGRPVIDGDLEHGDLRLMDEKVNPDAVVLLRAKGSLIGEPPAMDGFVKPLN